MKAIATKFAKHEVPELEELVNSVAYKLREKLNSGEELTRDEKNWITESVNYTSFFKGPKDSILVLGWRFDFSDVLKTYVVKQHGNYQEYRAIDRTSLRSMLHGKIDALLEYHGKINY